MFCIPLFFYFKTNIFDYSVIAMARTNEELFNISKAFVSENLMY